MSEEHLSRGGPPYRDHKRGMTMSNQEVIGYAPSSIGSFLVMGTCNHRALFDASIKTHPFCDCYPVLRRAGHSYERILRGIVVVFNGYCDAASAKLTFNLLSKSCCSSCI